MLSIETTPPDPPCLPCEIPLLKSGSDETASHKLALPEIDLSKRSLDHPTPLPKFSIRDYVFTARSKDIRTNWPFSPKILQLCLKHGVKDLLPPFQRLDTLRNQSAERWTVESSSLEKEKISNFTGEPSGLSNHEVLDSSNDGVSNKKPVETCIDQTTCRFEGENDFPSATSNFQSEIETDHTLLEASAKVEAGGPSVSQKTESINRAPGKKCRLIVKFGSKSSWTEYIASNCTTLSETMASKVCPVCKTFSSSSNTTLNAHIDQCLSVESTPKWTADSELTRHRIKPRKTKLMVDIYATAARCTLEELDRRNGTSWATVSSLPTQETEVPGEGKKQRLSLVHPEDSGDVGAVYIDASGTKLRILSKFNDPSVSKVEEGFGSRKSLKGGKGSKFLSTKKKRRRSQKNHKYLKLSSQSKKFCSLNAHCSQIYGDRGKHYGAEKSYKEVDCEMPKFKSQEHIKGSDSGTLRQWVCSKRTGLAKKVNSKDVRHPLISNLCVNRDLLVESNQSSLGESLADRSHMQSQRYVISCDTPISSFEDSESMENPLYEGLVDKKREHNPGNRRMESPLTVSRISKIIEKSHSPMKRKANKLGKNSISVCDSSMLKLPNSVGHQVSLMSNKIVIPPSAITEPARFGDAFSLKPMRFSKVRKNVLSVGQSLATEPKINLVKKCSARMRSQVNFLSEMDEEIMAWHSEVDPQYDMMNSQTKNQFGREDISDEVSPGRSSALETRQERGATEISPREAAVAFKCSKSGTHFCGHYEGENIDSSVGFDDDFPSKFDGLESASKEGMHVVDIATEPSSKLAFGMHLSKSLGSEFHRLGNRSKIRSNSLRSIENYKGPVCGSEALTGAIEPIFVGGQYMFCADEVGNILNRDKGNMVAEFNSEIGQGSSFSEVPIPGPPGSFLPSPRDMGSEDFQGNSSLTTSLVQYSQDQQDLVDGDSPDSPISAASTISNPMAGGSNMNSSEPSIYASSGAIQDKNKSGSSGASIVEPSVENVATVAQTKSHGAERIIPSGEHLEVNKISIKMGPLSLKNDQPCCCQRKERIFQAVAQNYIESQLVRRHAMTPAIVSSTEKKMGCSPNTGINHFEARPEIFPLSSCTSSESEKVISSVMKCPVGPNPLKNCPDAGVKFSGRGDCDSASSYASNPVLRLMGKNLMVVNKDEDASVPLWSTQAQPHSPNNNLTSQFPSYSRVSPGKIQNQVFRSFQHMVPGGSLLFSEDSHNTVGQCFDVRLSNSLRTQPNSNTLVRVPECMFANQRMSGSLAASMEPPDCQDRQKNRLNLASTNNLEKVVTSSHHQHKNAESISNPIQEIIVIDDVSESEADLTSDVAKCNTGALGEDQVRSTSNTFPTVPNYDLKHKNPFSFYQSHDASLLGESPKVHNGGFRATLSRQSNASPPLRWSCTSENSSVLQRSSFNAASSSTSHLRPSLYYSPSLS